MSTGLNTSGGSNRLRFETFSSRLQKIQVDVVHRVRATGSLDLQKSLNPSSGNLGCYLQDELEERKCLDGTSKFRRFYHELWPLVQSLPELLHHQRQVVNLLCKYVISVDSNSLSSSLQLISVLARDLQEDLYEHFHFLFAALVQRINTAYSDANISGSARVFDPELTGKIIESMSYLIKYQTLKLREEPDSMNAYYGPLLGHSHRFVRNLSAKCFVIVIRKLKQKAFKSHTKRLLKALVANCKSRGFDFNPEKLTVEEIEAKLPSSQLPKRFADVLEGVSLLMFHTFKGIKGCLHSDGGSKLSTLLSLLTPISRLHLEGLMSALQNSSDPAQDKLSTGSNARSFSKDARKKNASASTHVGSTTMTMHKSKEPLLQQKPSQQRIQKSFEALPLEQRTAVEALGADTSFRVVTGCTIAESVRLLFRYLHPSNAAELWIRLLASAESVQLGWRLLAELGPSSSPHVDSMLQHQAVSAAYHVEVLIFGLRHSNGRGLSDSAVRKGIAANAVETCLSMCKAFLQYVAIVAPTARTGAISPAIQRLVERTQLLFCHLWLRYPSNPILLQSADEILDLVLQAPSSCPAVLLLAQELLPSLPSRVVRKHLVHPMIHAVSLLMDSQATQGTVQGTAQAQQWLEVLVNLLTHLHDTRDDGLGGEVRSLAVPGAVSTGKTRGGEEERIWIDSDDDHDEEDDEEEDSRNRGQRKYKSKTEDACVHGLAGMDELLAGCNANLAAITDKCVEIVADTVRALSSIEATRLTGDDSQWLNAILAISSIRWLAVAYPRTLTDTEALQTKLRQCLLETVELLSREIAHSAKIASHLGESASLLGHLAQLTATLAVSPPGFSGAATHAAYLNRLIINYSRLCSGTNTATIVVHGLAAAGGSNSAVGPRLSMVWGLLGLLEAKVVKHPQPSLGLDKESHVARDVACDRSGVLVSILSAGDLDALFESLSAALTTPSYWLRLSLLRLLCYFPRPGGGGAHAVPAAAGGKSVKTYRNESPQQPTKGKNKSKQSNTTRPSKEASTTEAMETEFGAEEEDTVDLAGLCLDIARTPLAVRTEREFSRLIGAIEVLVRSGRLATKYVRLVCALCLGLLNVKFMPVWEPAVLVMVAAVEREDGEQVLWPLLLGVIQTLSHKEIHEANVPKRLEENAPESSKTDKTSKASKPAQEKLKDAAFTTDKSASGGEKASDAAKAVAKAAANAAANAAAGTNPDDGEEDDEDEELFFESTTAEHESAAQASSRSLGLLLKKLCELDDCVESISVDVSCSEVFYYNGSVALAKEPSVAPDSRTDCEVAYATAWNVLKRCPTVTLKRSKAVVPMFLRFLREQYYSVFEDDPEIPLLHKIGLLSASAEATLLDAAAGDAMDYNRRRLPQLPRRLLKKRLEMFLQVFAAVVSPRQLFQHQTLAQFYSLLLSKAETNVAKLALECLLAYKPKFLIPYKDSFKRILDDKTIREELVLFNAAAQSDTSELSINSEHRADLVPLLTRLVFGRFVAKARNNRAREQTMARRTAVLAFLSNLPSEELCHLVHMMLRGVVPKSLLLQAAAGSAGGLVGPGGPGQVQAAPELLDSRRLSTADLLSTWYADVEAMVFGLEPGVMAQVAWERQVGYLHLLEQVVKIIGLGMNPYVGSFCKIVAVLLTHAQTVRSAAMKDKTSGGSGVDALLAAEEEEAMLEQTETAQDEEVLVELLDEPDEVEAEDAGFVFSSAIKDSNQSIRVRTLCLQRMAEIVTQYHAVFPFHEVVESMLAPLWPLVSSLPNSIAGCSRPPALLRFISALVVHPETVAIVAENPSIVQAIIKCIASRAEHAVMVVVVTVLTILLERDGGEPIKPHTELLIHSFSKRFSGNTFSEGMREVKLSELRISPTGIKKELALLCLVAETIFNRDDVVIDPVSVSSLATLLLGMVRTYTTTRKIRVEEEWVLHILRTYKSLLWRMPDVKPHVPFVSRLFGPSGHSQSLFNFASVRAVMIEVYAAISEHASTAAAMRTSATALADITAIDPTLLDSRDFDRCMPVFQGLSSDSQAAAAAIPTTAAVTTTQHSSKASKKSLSSFTWSLLLGPAGGHSPRSASLCTAVVYECIRCMYDPELVIRNAAVASLKRFVEEVGGWQADRPATSKITKQKSRESAAAAANASAASDSSAEADSGSWLDILRSIVIPGIHAGIQQSSDVVKRDFVSLLAHVTRYFSCGAGAALVTEGDDASKAMDHVFHTDLAVLTHDDPEQDFFQNITHVQMHRRVRALAKLRMQLLKSAPMAAPGPTGSSLATSEMEVVSSGVAVSADGVDDDASSFKAVQAPNADSSLGLDEEAGAVEVASASAITLTISSLTHVLLPLGFHPLVCVEFTKKDHLTLLQECAAFLGAVAKHLPWAHYFKVIKSILKLLDHRRADREKVQLTALCAVLDAFHFDMYGDCEAEGLEVVVAKGKKKMTSKQAGAARALYGAGKLPATSGGGGAVRAGSAAAAAASAMAVSPEEEDEQSDNEAEEADEAAGDGTVPIAGDGVEKAARDDEEEDEDTEAPDGPTSQELNRGGVSVGSAEQDSQEVRPQQVQPQAHQIAKTIVNSIMPWVHVFMIKEEQDHKGQKSKTVRPQVAVALTKLVCRLEAPVVSDQRKVGYFVNLVITVIGTLRSRDTSARDAARDSLAKMVQTMGMSSLRPVIYEMQHMLVSGYQRHVCNYTLRSLLAAVLVEYHPPADAPSISIAELMQGSIAGPDKSKAATIKADQSSWDDEVEEPVDDPFCDPSIVRPDFDQCIPLIMQSVMDDLNGDTQDDLEATQEGSARAVIRESKGSKANDTLEICARCILFRPTYALRSVEDPSALSSVHALTAPLLAALVGCDDQGLIGRVGEALQRVSLGLSRNISVKGPELLLYLHSTLQPFIQKIVIELQRRKKAIGRILKPENGPNGVQDEDDDALLGSDLPSYMREESSDEEEAALYSRKKQKPGECVAGLRASLWLPSERRALLEQRQVVAERNRERAERDKVLDGASAPKLTGFTRNKRIRAAGAGAGGGTDPAAVAAVRFCLTLFQSALKQNRLDSDDAEIRAMIAPFLPLLGQCLRMEGAAQVVAQAMRCVCAILAWGVEVEPGFARAVGTRMLKIMFKGGALLSTDTDLVQACIKGLTSLFQLHAKRVADNKATATEKSKAAAVVMGSEAARRQSLAAIAPVPMPLRDENLRSLLQLMAVSIMEVTANFQNAAFQLIRVLVDAKVMLPEMYDLMDKLMEQVVLSQRKGIRDAASGVVVSFLLGYPLGEKRFAAHMKQLLANCAYMYEEGRISALQTLATLVRLLPAPVLEDNALMIFLPMALRMVNDNSAQCREVAAEVLSSLARKVGPSVFGTIVEYAFKWLASNISVDPASKMGGHSAAKFAAQATQEQQQQRGQARALLRTGAQVVSVLVAARPDMFKKSDRVGSAVRHARRALGALVTVSENFSRLQKADSGNGGGGAGRTQAAQKRRASLQKRELSSAAEGQGESGGAAEEWAVIYHILMLFETLFCQLPALTDQACTNLLTAEESGGAGVESAALQQKAVTKSPKSPIQASSNLAKGGRAKATPLLTITAAGQSEQSEPHHVVMEVVQEALLFPHAWVRAAASRVLQLYLSRREPSLQRCRQQLAERGAAVTEILLAHNGLYQLARRLCLTLNQPELAESHLEASTRALVFIIQAMAMNPDLAVVPVADEDGTKDEGNDDDDGGFEVDEELGSEADLDRMKGADSDSDDDDDDEEGVGGEASHDNDDGGDDDEGNDDENEGNANLQHGDGLQGKVDGGAISSPAAEKSAENAITGANWVMQRLRGLGMDTRGRRRLHVIKLFTELCSVSDVEFVSAHSAQITEVALRVRNTDTGPDLALLKITKEAAMQLLEILEAKLGSSQFILVFSETQRRLQGRKAERKKEAATEAIYNPRAHALRKIAAALKKKDSKKRKNVRFAAIKGVKKSR